jgi:hypothetical protein
VKAAAQSLCGAPFRMSSPQDRTEPVPTRDDGRTTPADPRRDGAITPWSSDSPIVPAAWPESSTALKFEVLTTQPRPNQGAFAPLCEEGARSQVVAARISAGGAPLQDAALIVQRDRYGVDGGDNPSVEARFERKRAAAVALSKKTDAAPRVFDVFPADSELARGEPSPPLFFCTKKSEFFRPRCSTCASVLRDCRKDDVLFGVNAAIAAEGRHGRVGSWTRTTERYLHCPTCAQSGERPVLYARAFVGEQHRRPEDFANLVRDKRGLLRDFGEGMRKGVLKDEHLPCASCDQRDTCFPADAKTAGPGRFAALDVVRPLSFYDFRAYVAERLDLRYDRATELIGGRPFRDLEAERDFRDRAFAEEATSGRGLRERLSGDAALLYGGDAKMRGPEVLLAKLALFADVLRAARDVVEHVGAHLDLRPENVMVVAADAAPWTPGLWNLRAKILGAGAAARVFEGRPELPQDLFEPPESPDPAYAPAILRDASLWSAPTRVKALTLTYAEPVGRGCLLRAECSGQGTPEDVGPRDSLVATLETESFDVFDVAFRPSESREQKSTTRRGDRPLSLVAELPSIEPWRLEALRAACGAPFTDVRIRVHRRLDAACDLHALGVMLLKTLLDNGPAREDDPFAGPEALRKAAEKFLARRVFVSDAADGAERQRTALAAFAEEDEAYRSAPPEARGPNPPWFARERLFFDADDRARAEDSVPRDLFDDALLVALRLISDADGFGYGAEIDPKKPASVFDAPMHDLRRVVDQLRAQLFGAARLNRDVNRAIDAARREARSTLFSGGTVLMADPEAEAHRRAADVAKEIEAMAADPSEDSTLVFERIKRRISSEVDAARGVCDPGVMLDDLRRRFPYVDEKGRREGAKGAEVVKVCQDAIMRARDAVFGEGGPGSTQVVVGGDDPAIEVKKALRIVELFAELSSHADGVPDSIAEIDARRADPSARFGRVKEAIERWFVDAAASTDDAPVDVREVRDLLSRALETPTRLYEAYSFAVRRGLREILARFKPDDEKGIFGRKDEIQRLKEAYEQLSSRLENEPVDLLRRFFDPHFRQKFDESSIRKADPRGAAFAPTELAMEADGPSKPDRRKKRK